MKIAIIALALALFTTASVVNANEATTSPAKSVKVAKKAKKAKKEHGDHKDHDMKKEEGAAQPAEGGMPSSEPKAEGEKK